MRLMYLNIARSIVRFITEISMSFMQYFSVIKFLEAAT